MKWFSLGHSLHGGPESRLTSPRKTVLEPAPSLSVPSVICPHCRALLPPGSQQCSYCQTLLHGNAVESLVAQARLHEQAGDLPGALMNWRDALPLLPPGTPEHQAVARRVTELSEALNNRSTTPLTSAPPRPDWARRLGPLAPLALLLWKFKAALLLAATKGKLLLLGLTKLSTLSSLLLSLGAYWALYGWVWALGVVLSIYIHEMGHVYALRQLGVRSSAPLFMPLFGAMVWHPQFASRPWEEARVGLAGPQWGMWASLVCFAGFALTDVQAFGPIAHFGAWINLFNLLPVFIFDGKWAFQALDRRQRAIVTVVVFALALLTREGFLAILGAVAAYRLFTKDAPEQGDRRTLLQYLELVTILALLLLIPVPRAFSR